MLNPLTPEELKALPEDISNRYFPTWQPGDPSDEFEEDNREASIDHSDYCNIVRLCKLLGQRTLALREIETMNVTDAGAAHIAREALKEGEPDATPNL